MFEKSRDDDVDRGRARAGAVGVNPGGLAKDAQVFASSALALRRRSRWSEVRGAARPIDLERRARFARFDA